MSHSNQEMNATDAIKEGNRRRKGCFVTNTKAYVLFFIYVASLVAVGLVIHFLVDRPSSKVDGPPVTEATPTSAPRKSLTNVRLPRSVLPRHYNLRLLPILEKGNFSIIGHVDIDVEVMEDTGKITLHINDIVVDQSSLKVIARLNLIEFNPKTPLLSDCQEGLERAVDGARHVDRYRA